MLFLDEFEGMSLEEAIEKIVNDYEVEKEKVQKFELVVIFQNYGDYDGNSWFLLKDKETGKLFENCGGHCSCYGFEGQFHPEETSITALNDRALKGHLFYTGGYDSDGSGNLNESIGYIKELYQSWLDFQNRKV
jgi:hypothetical protein